MKKGMLYYITGIILQVISERRLMEANANNFIGSIDIYIRKIRIHAKSLAIEIKKIKKRKN